MKAIYVIWFLVWIIQGSMVYGQESILNKIVTIDMEGANEGDVPDIQIGEAATTKSTWSVEDHSVGRSVSLSSRSVYPFSIEATGGELLAPGQGTIVSMWIRSGSKTDSSVVSLLMTPSQKEPDADSLLIGSCTLSGRKWTWLAGWIFRDSLDNSPRGILLRTVGIPALEVSDIIISYSPRSLARDERPPLRIEKDRIMDGEREIRLEGMNFNAYSSKQKDHIHKEFTLTREDDYRRMAKEGFNVIRLNLWYEALQIGGGWQWLDIHRMWARRNGLRLILDLHAPPGGYQGPLYHGSFWDESGESNKMREETIRFWKEAADKYKDDPTIAAFDLINEPKPERDVQWWSFVRQAIEAIREEGFHQPVIVEKSFAPDSKFELLNDSGIIYDFHFYDPWPFVSGEEGVYNTAFLVEEEGVLLNQEWLESSLMKDGLEFALANNVPVNIGEYGISNKALDAGGADWLRDLVQLLDTYDIGRQYWCWHTYLDFCIDRSGMNRHHPSEIEKSVLDIVSVKRRRVEQVTHTDGLVAFWDFKTMQKGAWTSYSDHRVTEQQFPVFLKRIGDQAYYIPENWPYQDEHSRVLVQSDGPFGHAIRFNKGYIFGEVPRSSFDKTYLDLRQEYPFTLVAWIKYVGERHMVAGIWDEGGWNKYSGRRQAALFGGLFGGQKGVIAHVSATGAASFPQSTLEGSQYARLRSVDGQAFENEQWVSIAMTFDPANDRVSAFLNGRSEVTYFTDPIEQDVFRYDKEILSNPYHFQWPIYSPESFILKFNGYQAIDGEAYEHWLEVDLSSSFLTYGSSYPDGITERSLFRISFDVERSGSSLFQRKVTFKTTGHHSLPIAGMKDVKEGDILITSLERRKGVRWEKIGDEIRYRISEGAPFTFGRALGLGSEELEDGTQLYIDGVAVFNRVLSSEELQRISFCPPANTH